MRPPPRRYRRDQIIHAGRWAWASSGGDDELAGISVACLIAYTYAAVTQLKLGNLAGGVTWAYFGAFFAGASAFNYFIGWMAAKYAWEADGRIQGWMWIVLGIVLIIETPIFMKYSNAAAWISIIAADIGIVTLSFVFWGKGGSAMVDISAWSFFVAGVGGVLNAGDGILQGVGWKPPTSTSTAAPLERPQGRAGPAAANHARGGLVAREGVPL